MPQWERRPIDTWPGKLTFDRKPSPFRAHWDDTIVRVDRELWHLDATNIVLMEAYSERDLRVDGEPRARAVRLHPGVILAFDSNFGALKYACDRFDDWRANVRAIALGLEALRKVDRYGITNRGEQYTGWKAIGSGIEMGAAPVMSYMEAVGVVYSFAGVNPFDANVDAAYRLAVKKHHPDVGGDENKFKQLQQAWEIVKCAPDK